MDSKLNTLALELGNQLSGRNWRIVTAESCTGGWIAQSITAIAGSSGWFDRGFVTYSNEAKQDMLGVSASTLREHGAVSKACVRELALGALTRSRAQLAVAVSGIAGPGGGSADKPVGTVFIAWARGDRPVRVLECHFTGERESIRRQTVETALQGLLEELQTTP